MPKTLQIRLESTLISGEFYSTDDFRHTIGTHDWLKLDKIGIENSGELNFIRLNATLLSWINPKS